MNDATIVVLDLPLNLVIANLDDLSAGFGADTLINDLLSSRGKLGKSKVGVEALGSDQLGSASSRLRLGGGGSLDTLNVGEIELGVLCLEGVEISSQGGGAFLGKVHETVVVGLLGVLVDDTAREALHLRAVNGANLGEDTGGGGVAAELGEEDGNVAGLEDVDELVVAGLLEAAGAAPGVAVKSEHVTLGHIISITGERALEVVVRVCQDVADVGSRIADGDGPGYVLLDVILDVAGDSAHVRGDGGTRLLIVHDLVAGEEAEGVGVVLEGLNDCKGAVKVLGIIRFPRVEAGKGLADQRGVDVEKHVHARSVEDTGALIVVEIRVEVVNTDGVDTQNLHQGRITQANVLVAKRVTLELGVVAS